MKKFVSVFLLVAALSLQAAPASAVFASKGAIPGGEPVEYRGLKITDKGVNIIIVNRSGEKPYDFSAALSFVTRRKEFGDVYIEKMTLAPNEHRQLTNLHLKGGAREAKKADSLRWTIYTLEESSTEQGE